MIRYKKGPVPPEITAIASTPGVDWNALSREHRESIRAALVRDQAGLCAYCQQRITAHEDSSTGLAHMKIEHWQARSEPAARPLAWRNLVGVCMGVSRDLFVRGGIVRHCDTSRGNRKLFLHPVDGEGPDPATHLRYAANGQVQPNKVDPRVNSDIIALNLNANVLARGREVAYDAIWNRLQKAGFTRAAIRKLQRQHEIVPGTTAPPHAAFVQYHLTKKLRSLGHSST